MSYCCKTKGDILLVVNTVVPLKTYRQSSCYQLAKPLPPLIYLTVTSSKHMEQCPRNHPPRPRIMAVGYKQCRHFLHSGLSFVKHCNAMTHQAHWSRYIPAPVCWAPTFPDLYTQTLLDTDNPPRMESSVYQGWPGCSMSPHWKKSRVTKESSSHVGMLYLTRLTIVL